MFELDFQQVGFQRPAAETLQRSIWLLWEWEPVTPQLQVGLTQSSCMSAAPQLKSGSDVPADESTGGFWVR